MKAGVIVFPGSNCDRDVFETLEKVGAKVQKLWHKDTTIPDLDLIVIPGGFSYGDYLRSGAIAAKSPIMQEVSKRAAQGVHVLGICNGFQILTEAGLLPGALLCNKKLKFLGRHVYVKVETNKTAFSGKYNNDDILELPIAHHDGNYFADADTLKSLEDNGQVVFRYCDKNGNINENACPNGALHNIAGICNKEGNVLGMMPHPERAADELKNNIDGLGLFKNLVEKLI